MTQAPKPKKSPGRPKKAPTRVIPLRLPLDLAERLEAFADLHGLSRNEAGQRLIELALSPPDRSGYDPLTGDFNT